ncbi:MAG: T9SS type A sorting domain-containing protein [Saprospiraceae bacterium]
MKNIILLTGFLAISALLPAQNVIFVRSDADPDQANGYSWATAYPDLNDALSQAFYGDEIWVAGGVYHPTGGGNRMLSFTLSSGVKLYGGFSGTETSKQQRDWVAQPTILSGDIGAPGQADDNSYCILYAAQTDSTTTVDGFVFEYGNANNPDDVGVFSHERTQSGAAIYLMGQGSGKFAYIRLNNCIFRYNHSDYYGSVFANGRDSGRSGVWTRNCEFYGNLAGYAGAGVVVENYYSPQYPISFIDTDFHDNIAQVHGGGLYLTHHADVLLRNCKFVHDSIYYSAGAALVLKGEGINGQLLFDKCVFDRNATGNAGSVGGIMLVEAQNSALNLQFRRCIFSGNSGLDGFFNASIFGTLTMQFEQCIFRENKTVHLLYDLNAEQEVQYIFVNSLFYNNTGREFANNNDDPILLDNCIVVQSDNQPSLISGSAPVTLHHTLVSQPDCAALGPSVMCEAGNLFALDPQFADPANGDFHLLPCSPALDAGDNAAAAAFSTDLDGQARLANAAVDLGPYETRRYFLPATQQPASCYGAADGSVTFVANACAPYALNWVDDQGHNGNNTNGLPAGNYRFYLSDPNGYLDSAEVNIYSPPQLLVYTTIVPASGPAHADGAVLVDSATGGTPPYPWTNGEALNGLSNLLPGSYTTTLTDAWGCSVVLSFEVGFVSATNSPDEAAAVWLSPNPANGITPSRLHFEAGAIERVELYSSTGQRLTTWEHLDGTTLDLPNNLPSGAYHLNILLQQRNTPKFLVWINP